MKNIKRILAIVCIVLLVALYLITLILSIFDSSTAMVWFKGSVVCTIFIPIVAYCYICLHKFAMNRSGRKNYYDKEKDSEEKSSKS